MLTVALTNKDIIIGSDRRPKTKQ